MYFEDIASLIAMGGHGSFVWLAYGATSLIIIYNVTAPILLRKKLKRQIISQQRRQARQKTITQPN